MLISEYRDFLCRLKDEKVPAIQAAFNQELVKAIHLKRVTLEGLTKKAEAEGLTSPEHEPSVTALLFGIEEHLDALIQQQNTLLDEVASGIDNILTDIGFVSDDKSLIEPGIFDAIPELHTSIHLSSALAQSYEAILESVYQGDYPLIDILEREYAALDQLIMLIESPAAIDEAAIWLQFYENIDYLKQQQAIPIS